MKILKQLAGVGIVLSFVSCSGENSNVESSWHEDSEARLIAKEDLASKVHESFGVSYVMDADLVGQGPANSGFVGSWLTNKEESHKVSSSGLEYSGLVSSGGCIVSNPTAKDIRNGRRLQTSYTDSSNEDVYISFLLKLDSAALKRGYCSFELHDSSLGAGENGFEDMVNRVFSIGIAKSDYGTAGFGLRVKDNNQLQAELSNRRNTNVNLFVLKFSLSDNPSSDSVTAWMNPDLDGTDEPIDVVTVSGFDLSFDTVSFARFGRSEASLDEIRIGSSFLDVTPRQQ